MSGASTSSSSGEVGSGISDGSTIMLVIVGGSEGSSSSSSASERIVCCNGVASSIDCSSSSLPSSVGSECRTLCSPHRSPEASGVVLARAAASSKSVPGGRPVAGTRGAEGFGVRARDDGTFRSPDAYLGWSPCAAAAVEWRSALRRSSISARSTCSRRALSAASSSTCRRSARVSLARSEVSPQYLGCGMYVLRDVPGTFFLVMQDTRGKIVVWLEWVWFRSTIRLRWTAGSRNVATLRPASGNWQRTSGTIWTYLRQRFSQHSLQCITFCAERHYLCRQKINLEFQVLQPEPGG